MTATIIKKQASWWEFLVMRLCFVFVPFCVPEFRVFITISSYNACFMSGWSGSTGLDVFKYIAIKFSLSLRPTPRVSQSFVKKR